MQDRPNVLVLLDSEDSPFAFPLSWTQHWATRHPLLRVEPLAIEHETTMPNDGSTVALDRAIVVVCSPCERSISTARRHGHVPIVAGPHTEAERTDAESAQHPFAVPEPEHVRCVTASELVDALERALAHPIDFRVNRDTVPQAPASVGHRSSVGHRQGPPSLPAPRRAGSGPLPTVCPRDGWPDVTTIVAARTHSDALRRTLRSLAGQDYPGRIHTLVVPARGEPDASLPAGTENRSLAGVANTRSPGLAGARNSGILAATSDYVAFCDDGDTWLPHKLRAQVELLRTHPDTDLVACGIRAVGDRREADHTPRPGRITFSDLLRYCDTEVHPSTFLLRRSTLISRTGLIDERIPGTYAKDYELLLRVARNGTVRACPEPAVRVPWHLPSPYSEAWQATSSALRWLLSEYPEFGLVRSGYARVAGQVAFAEAAAGHRRVALRWIATTLRNYPIEPRAYLATAIAGGVSPSTILNTLHRRGRGF